MSDETPTPQSPQARGLYLRPGLGKTMRQPGLMAMPRTQADVLQVAEQLIGATIRCRKGPREAIVESITTMENWSWTPAGKVRQFSACLIIKSAGERNVQLLESEWASWYVHEVVA